MGPVPNFSLLNNHSQLTQNSCIPMSVECVLKLLGLMPGNTFPYQNDPQKSGNSHWVRGLQYPLINPQVVFDREFLLTDLNPPQQDRGAHFMFNYYSALFATIDDELMNNRYIIISLESGQNMWHQEIVYNKIDDSAYETLTFYHNQQGVKKWTQDLRSRVTAMQGTDILTYKYLP